MLVLRAMPPVPGEKCSIGWRLSADALPQSPQRSTFTSPAVGHSLGVGAG